MNINVGTFDFQKAIKKLENVTKGKKSMKVLECIKIQTKNNNKVELSATDLEIDIIITLDANIIESGEMLLNSNNFKMIHKFKSVDLTITDEKIVSDKRELKFKSELLVKEFPKISTLKKMKKDLFNISQKELYNALQVKYAASTDEIRPILCSVCFNKNEVVSVDGFRLAWKKLSIDTNLKKCAVNLKSIEILQKILDKKSDKQIKVYAGDNINGEDSKQDKGKMYFEFDDVLIACKTIQGEYLNYEQIIPSDYETVIETELKPFKEEIDIHKGIIDELEYKSVPVIFNINNSLKIESKNNFQDYESELDANIEGKELRIGFNPAYMLDALKYISDKVKIEFTKAIAPAVIKGVNEYDLNALLLPIRIKETY